MATVTTEICDFAVPAFASLPNSGGVSCHYRQQKRLGITGVMFSGAPTSQLGNRTRYSAIF